jgi:phenylacetate-coenzyme A ligase PaaK-like adenylate-forming protein
MSLELPKTADLEERVFSIHNEDSFQTIALEVYHFQYHNNPLYRAYCQTLGRIPGKITRLEEIPFLPISFFKSHPVKSGDFRPELVFESSGTTGTVSSKHLVKNLGLYETSFLKAFRMFFGEPSEFCILGLLPSYLERGSSSLVYMVDHLMKMSGHGDSGFYLHDHEKLAEVLKALEDKGEKAILFGVSYALLDLAASQPMKLNHTTLIETGGMKGRKKEISKQELYDELKQAFSLSHIYSEYGMTELLSQAYAKDGIYTTPSWMRILLREETDPLQIIQQVGKTGVINVIDLANLYSCSFIATDDAGRIQDKGFEVLGRIDRSDIRGCSLMLG